MMEPVEFPESLKSRPINNDDWATNGMAFRKRKQRNLVKSLYLDPKLLNRHNLNLKAKYECMQKEEVRFEAYNMNTDYQALIISYGTMSRVCRTAVDLLAANNFQVAMIRPKTLFPFPLEAIYNAALKESCQVVVSIEMSMGQMVEDVARAVGRMKPVRWYGQCGGEIPSPDEIIDFVKTTVE
jgi:2-oxoglutarate/2-oxoacid ferredoxin oxidoreductase subunit alpha